MAVERDLAVAEALRWVLREHGLWGPERGRVWLVAADILTFPLERLGVAAGSRLLVAGNLPYGITSPLLMALTTAGGWCRAVVMVQKEVAARLVAPPGNATYGALTVAVGARCAIRRLFDVSRRCFHPVPDVDSTVLELQPRPRRAALLGAGRSLGEALEEVLRAAFGQRRKTLRNAMARIAGRRLSPEEVAQLCRRAGVEPDRRGEELTIEQFLSLAEAWSASPNRPQAHGSTRPAPHS